MSTPLVLRDVISSDLPVFFEHQRDPDAVRMAQVPARERAEFEAHWNKIRRAADNVIRAIVVDGEVAGNVCSFDRLGVREVGYWLGREYWGRGIATRALMAFLRVDAARPLYARVSRQNPASLRVLEKCGFREVDEDIGSLEPPGEEVDEHILKLDGR